jgi:C-methyltransferase C-terminal domain/Methyltransferase domain/Putative zinc binding domain
MVLGARAFGSARLTDFPSTKEIVLFPAKIARAAGTGASVPVECCQVCGHAPLTTVLSLGYMPPVNQMVPIGEVPRQQPWFPTNLLHCPRCELVQLGLAVDPVIIFPPEYPYTSGMTKVLRDNFADLYAEASAMLALRPEDVVIDIGSNDGTLLSNFKNGGHRVLGIEPTEVGRIAETRGIPTLTRYFSPATAAEVKRQHGAARVVTAANCFAHIEDVHAIVEGILDLLAPDGVFISESHYLIGLLDKLQYDTVYHEHLRYYSVGSLAHLLRMHGLEVFHARPIPSHGGSIRVYAARRGVRPVHDSVAKMLAAEPRGEAMRARLDAFRNDVMLSKLRLLAMIRDLKEKGARICGISAPSRASTLVNYVGLDEALIDYVCEIAGSLKIGKCMPGTLIPVVEESRLFTDQPDCAIIFSWHIADELAPKLRAKGYRGMLITPLPDPRAL